jgi:1-acyl-sn-glycerol-3-phosphate acyltransferase
MFYTFITIASAFLIIGYYDIELRIRSIFARSTLESRLSYVSWNAPRLFFALARHYLDFAFIFENAAGRPMPERFMVIGNHQSFLDIPVVFYYFAGYDVRFVSKKELGRWVPLISQVLRHQGHCLIDRHANQIQSMKRLDAFAHLSATKGWCPVIFPEGTRSRDGAVGTFHSAGVRRMLDLTPLPVVAIAIDGGWKISEMKSLANLKGARYRLRILGVYDVPANKKESAALLENAHTVISAQVDAWNARR